RRAGHVHRRAPGADRRAAGGLRTTRRPLDYLAAHPSSATLVVEVADSTLRSDRQVKTRIYARAGLPDFWIVNLVDRVVEVHREPGLSSDAMGWSYRSVEVLMHSAAVIPLAAPGASIAVADLLPCARPQAPQRRPRLASNRAVPSLAASPLDRAR